MNVPRFCAEDPDGGGPVTGKDIAIESARQLCIWEETAVKDPAHPQSGERRRSWKWWEYVTKVTTFCPIHTDDVEKRFGSEACSTALMQQEGGLFFLEVGHKNRSWPGPP